MTKPSKQCPLAFILHILFLYIYILTLIYILNTLTLFREFISESLCIIHPSLPWTPSGGRPCSMQQEGNLCRKAVLLLLLPGSCPSVWLGLQEVFVVTRAGRVPAAVCCDCRIQTSFCPAPHAARGCAAA